MKLLALDTTQEFCSVALSYNASLIYREEFAPRTHTELILPQVESVLAEAGLVLTQLDAIAFGRGPGSFTGLRIAAGITQGLALGADVPVVPVSSLAAMAQGVYREDPEATHICAAFDARINEVYWGCYTSADDVMHSVTSESVDDPSDVRLPEQEKWLAIGSGWKAYPDMLQRLEGQVSGSLVNTVPLARDIVPLARKMYLQGKQLNADQAIPVYLRHKVAKTVAERGHAKK